MSALSARISSLAPFLLQAPPGQLENVYNDIAGLLLAEEEAEGSSLNAREVNAQLRKATDPALRDHNEQQFVVVKVKSAEAVDSRDVESTILCKEARIQQRGNDRYRHARLPVSFEIDHKTLTATAVEPLELNAEAEPLRRAWDAALAQYIGDRYPDGKAAVFARSLGEPTRAGASDADSAGAPSDRNTAPTGTEDEADKRAVDEEETRTDGAKAPEAADVRKEETAPVSSVAREVAGPTPLVAHIVGTKLNPRNFWAGRWRATYVYDPSSSAALAARYEIVVHYYENGNVQMNYAHSEDLPLSVVDTQDSAAIAKTLTRAVEKAEGEIAEGISKQVEELGGDAFRAMRRMLPVTKQKVNWDKLVSYKIGSELSK